MAIRTLKNYFFFLIFTLLGASPVMAPVEHRVDPSVKPYTTSKDTLTPTKKDTTKTKKVAHAPLIERDQKIESKTIAKISDMGVFSDIKWIDRWVGSKIRDIPDLEDVAFVIEDIKRNGNLHLIQTEQKDIGFRLAITKAGSLDEPLWRTTYKDVVLKPNPYKVTTIIGKWNQDTGPFLGELSSLHWNMFKADIPGIQPPSNGKFNLLNIDLTGKDLSDEEVWTTLNEPWLREAMERGDDIVLATDPFKFRYGFYQRELDFIEENAEKYGYDFIEGVSSGKLVKKVTNTVGANIPSSLATKLGDTRNIETWLTKYAEDLGDSSTLLSQLDNSIGANNVLEQLEDAQGRLVTVIERPGQSNLVSVIHKDANGTFKLTEFNPAYNPSLNPSIQVPLSANKLVPDYMGTQYIHPLQGNEVVKIKMSGNRNTDFTRARAELDISKADEVVNGKTYTWHHLDDFEIINGEVYCTMQLVESSAHQGTGVSGMQHSGSVPQWRAYFNSGF